jgi:uncharacterized protein (TIGR02246 family)
MSRKNNEVVMRWNGMVALSLFLASTGACSSSRLTVDVARDKAMIDTTREAYASAWRAGNAADVAGLYADDALVLYPNRPPIEGKAAIQTYFDQFFGDFIQDEFELTSAEIQIAGSWAFDRGAYRWKGTPKNGGSAIEDHGKFLVILQRQSDGSWKVARDMDNSDRPLTQATRGS